MLSSFRVTLFYAISIVRLIYKKLCKHIKMVSNSRFNHLNVEWHPHSAHRIQNFVLTSAPVNCDTPTNRAIGTLLTCFCQKHVKFHPSTFSRSYSRFQHETVASNRHRLRRIHMFSFSLRKNLHRAIGMSFIILLYHCKLSRFCQGALILYGSSICTLLVTHFTPVPGIVCLSKSHPSVAHT